MPKPKLEFHMTTIQDGKPISTETTYYEGERFLYKDYPDFTASLDYYGEWSILEGLCDTILYHRPFCVVELGAGESSLVLARAAQKANVTFHSVDMKPWKHKGFLGTYKFYLGKIEKFMEIFDDTPAIVLIDANHDYQVAQKEFDFFFDKLVEGGVIFLHDTYPPCERMLRDISCSDVYKLRQELEKGDRDKYDIFTWPYSAKWCGLTQVIKKEKDRPYWGL